MVESRVISKVKGTVDHYGETYSSATIKELNPQIFQWLDLMDLNVWIILALMLIVAGVTIDQRLAHHHPGTHLDDRHSEGFGRTQ